MKAQIQKFLREEDGITALEYGVLAAIIVVAVAALATYVATDFFGDSGWFHTELQAVLDGNSSGGGGGE